MNDHELPDKWIMVDQLKPVDLSNIADKGMQGIVLLGVSLGWNLIQRRGAPAQLKSRQGITRNIPTDTGVRQAVFWSVLANVLAHSEGRLPTSGLIDRIVKQTGMSKAHAQVLHSKVELLEGRDPNTLEPIEEEEEEPEMTEEEKWAWLNQAVADNPPPEEPPTPPVVEGEFAPTERVEKTLNFGKAGEQYVSEIMDTIIRQLVPDGEDQITYRCKVCGLEFETKRGVGAHWQVHVKAGEAKATAQNKRVVVNKVENYVPTEVHARRDSRELERLRKLKRDMEAILGGDMIEEYSRLLSAAKQENERLKARNDSLERSLNTLHELLGEIRETK